MCESTQEAQILAGTRLLTADELAQRLGFSSKHGARTVRQKVKDGSIPVVRINDHHLRFKWPDVMDKLSRITPEPDDANL